MSQSIKTALCAAVLSAVAAVVSPAPAVAQPAAAATPSLPTKTIVPGAAWSDDAGRLVQAHGAGFLKVGDTFYMFGEDKAAGGTFTSVSCYSSQDLTSWHFEGRPLSLQTGGDLGPNRVVERPKVVYNSSTRQYVMYVHIDSADYQEAKVGVATGSTPCGSYTYRGSSRPLGFQSRDIGLFKDDDGTGYLLTEDRANGLRIDRLSPDYLTVVSAVAVVDDLEAPALVKVHGRYMLFGSHLTGWATNDNAYASAASLSGPWTKFASFAPVGTNTFNSQTSSIVPVSGAKGTTYVFVGDRWLPNDLFDSAPVWLPIDLDGTTATMTWQGSWSLDAPAGTWLPQNADAVYEAEDPHNTLGDGAFVHTCTACSGGSAVSLVSGASVRFPSIYVPRAGTYTFKIGYTNGDGGDRFATLRFDRDRPVPLAFPPTLSGQAGVATVSVALKAGNHTATFGSNQGPAPDLDVISLPNGPSTETALTGPGSWTLPVGQPVTLTQTFTNHGGLSVTDVTLDLRAPDGWTLTAASPSQFTAVGPGATVRTTWQAVPESPAAPLTSTLTGTVGYSWDGRERASVRASVPLHVPTDISDPYRTFSSAGVAYVGQAGDKLAIAASGADVWGGTNEYAAIYQPKAFTSASTAEVRVDSQQMENDWTKSGLMVSNDVTKSGATAGRLILAVTPQHGVAMQWDSDGDGQLDTGVTSDSTVPVFPTWLKLVRDNSVYTGYFSTDGQSWHALSGTATLAGAASQQDVGVFTTAHNADAVGESDFSGFDVGH